MNQQEIARELLSLEKSNRKGGLSDSQTKRWEELAAKLFAKSLGNNKRMSTRLPAKVVATVQVGERSFPCTIDDMSLVGMTLSGEVFGYVDRNVPIRLRAVTIGKSMVSLDLKCNAVRFGYIGKTAVAGVTIASDGPSDALQSFFDKVYYPVYSMYLENIASGKIALPVAAAKGTGKGATKPAGKATKSSKPAAKATKPAAKATPKAATKPAAKKVAPKAAVKPAVKKPAAKAPAKKTKKR
ncbi:MAG: PilZ domain-containing protein [Polyangiaceae bacterium]|nr:PilZ domain-containing protein [Polyangiaceae bacterium]